MKKRVLKCFICGLDLKEDLKIKVLSYWKASCPNKDWSVYICNKCRKKSFTAPCNPKNLLWQKILRSGKKKSID